MRVLLVLAGILCLDGLTALADLASLSGTTRLHDLLFSGSLRTGVNEPATITMLAAGAIALLFALPRR